MKTTARKILVILHASLIIAGISSGVRGEGPTVLRTREFVVMGYEGIAFELRTSDGPYLRTLTDLLRTNPDQRTQTIEKIRSLSKSFPNIMDFADEVAKLCAEPTGNGLTGEVQVALPSGPAVYSGDRLESALNHLTRGMKITVFSRGGARFEGQFEEYAVRRLWLKGTAGKSFLLEDILAIEAPQL